MFFCFYCSVLFLCEFRPSVPNFDSKNLSYLVWACTQLFYVWDKIFLYMHNPWILLFQMIYKRPFFFRVFMKKLAVYDDELHLSILGALSLISTASHFLSLISTLIQNSSKIQSFVNKQIFHVFWSENEQRSLGQFCRACQDLS